MTIKELIIEDLDKLSTQELGKVYKFIRTELIAEIPNRKKVFSDETERQIKYSQSLGEELIKSITHLKVCNTCETVTEHIAGKCQICRRES